MSALQVARVLGSKVRLAMPIFHPRPCEADGPEEQSHPPLLMGIR